MSESADIPPFKVQKGEALHRQITNHFRSLISSGKLPAGSKLSRMHDLAAQWNTNYFTVHTALTRLVREGLLERKPRLGTFVRKQNKQLGSVGIYYGDEILIKHERAFYRSLHGQLLNSLQKENISAKVFIDSRPPALQEEPLVELLESVNSHAIHGLIVPLIGYPKEEWLSKMPLPTSFFSSARSDYSRICIDFNQIMTMACQTLSNQGCRTVGLIHPTPLSKPDWGKNENDTIPNAFNAQLKAFNMKTQKSWIRIPKSHQDSQEKFGYQEFHKLWDLKEKPDGLIVYPENVSHGVVIAVLERGVKVPSELKLVLHKNQHVEFLCPLPADWIITREKDIADALIQQIKDRFAGLEPHYYEIHHEFIKGSSRDLISKFALANNLEG